jgi:hypothetical protein
MDNQAIEVVGSSKLAAWSNSLRLAQTAISSLREIASSAIEPTKDAEGSSLNDEQFVQMMQESNDTIQNLIQDPQRFAKQSSPHRAQYYQQATSRTAPNNIQIWA